MKAKTKILIVEHDPADIEFIKRELKKGEIDFTEEIVQTQDNYESALKNFQPDIILSDYNLPSFSGVLAFEVKEKMAPHTPFIFVSGAIGEENAVELIKSGVTDYALKDKLYSLNPKIIRALKEAQERKEKIIAIEKIKKQNEKLFEIAFLQSHQVRGPVASILGLINLLTFNNPDDPQNFEVLPKVELAAKELDEVIQKIVIKTREIEQIQ